MTPLILHVHASCHNVGDHLLVQQIREALRGELDEGFEFASITPRRIGAFDPDRWIDQNDVQSGRLDPDSLSLLCSARLVLVGGGDLLTGRAAFRLYRALEAAGLPLYFLGVGVNLRNVHPRLRVSLLRGLMDARMLVSREESSYDQLSRAGLRNIRSGVDMSALLFDETAYRHRAEVPPRDEPVVGVSLRQPERNTAAWGDEEYSAIAAALDRLVEENGARIEFLSMTGEGGGPGNDDVPALERVRDAMTARMDESPAVTVVPKTPHDALRHMSRYDVLVGMRLHALALAALAAVPVAPFAYSPKIDGWWDQLTEEGSRGLFRERAPLPAEDWRSPTAIVQAIRSALSRTPAESEAIARSFRRQALQARSLIEEMAALMKTDLEAPEGPRDPKRLSLPRTYRLRTRLVEPLREIGERIVTRF